MFIWFERDHQLNFLSRGLKQMEGSTKIACIVAFKKKGKITNAPQPKASGIEDVPSLIRACGCFLRLPSAGGPV